VVLNKRAHPNNSGLGWVITQIILMIACALAGWLWHGSWPASVSGNLIAWVLITMGAGFGIAGVWVLGRNRTIFPEPMANSTLICHGIYRYVRHPLYSSVMCLAFGWGVARESLPGLAAALGLSLFLGLKSRNEEARLLRRFPGYDAYRATTRRFIPWLL
jgi:protein-S-isoprenylcysteine O-methyltransferase Ste14